jgi:tRNA uridine 5-carboxymethylaminomethyl modification enzyme
MLASIEGLDRAEMIRPGYAIEYDAVDPRELDHTLQVRSIPGLFLAGQINGTSGYEEAGCQGIIAGINAARIVGELDPITIARTEGYTGILIDDLISKGADEPYRMFTSRAEFRLHLRIDNADERLTRIGRSAGLVSDERWSLFQKKQGQKSKLVRAMEQTRVSTDLDTERPSVVQWVRRPENELRSMSAWVEEILLEPPAAGLLDTLQTEAKYAGYIRQQDRHISRLRDAESRLIPSDVSYSGIPGVSREIQEKLHRVQPATLGQAGRIPGVTPAAVAVLETYLRLSRST